MTDILIVGAGPVGCVAAQQLSKFGLKIKIIDRRNHIAGNCFDTYSKNKVLYHKYGPHYFRTKDNKLIKYLSNYSKFHDAKYIVKSFVNNKYYDFPINLNTINSFFNKNFSPNQAKKYLNEISIKNNQQNFEDFLLNRVGKEIYENFYKNYTIKQWGISPGKLPLSTAKRVPIRFNQENEYVNEKIKVMPSDGFTSMFKNMIDNKNISLSLDTDYFKIKEKIIPKLFTIYTGPIDKFFNYKFGKLGWRSLKFMFNEYKIPFKQKYLQINYPNNYQFTRKVEIKHVTKQKSDFTIISKEFPQSKGEPYYPVNSIEDKINYMKYKKLQYQEKNVFFIGRLAEYTYINTDQAIEKSLGFCKKIISKL